MRIGSVSLLVRARVYVRACIIHYRSRYRVTETATRGRDFSDHCPIVLRCTDIYRRFVRNLTYLHRCSHFTCLYTNTDGEKEFIYIQIFVVQAISNQWTKKRKKRREEKTMIIGIPSGKLTPTIDRFIAVSWL